MLVKVRLFLLIKIKNLKVFLKELTIKDSNNKLKINNSINQKQDFKILE